MLAASVIIPHYDDLDNLKVCLRLLDDQTLPRDEFEIIVADNNSKVGLEAVKEVVGNRGIVVHAPEQGAGPTRNVGVAASNKQAFALVFIDSDCRPMPQWLEEGLAALRTAEIVSGPVLMEPRDWKQITPVEAFDVVFGFRSDMYIHKIGFAGTGNLFVRRDVFEAVGPFRSEVAEDLEWSRRATATGFSLTYTPQAIVRHPARRNWPELVRKWRRHTREAYFLAREQRFGKLSWLLRSWAILGSPLLHVNQIFRSRELPSLRDKLGAAWVLFRIRGFRFVEAHRVAYSER